MAVVVAPYGTFFFLEFCLFFSLIELWGWGGRGCGFLWASVVTAQSERDQVTQLLLRTERVRCVKHKKELESSTMCVR